MILPNYETGPTECITLRLLEPFFVLSGEARGGYTSCLCSSCGKTAVRNFSTKCSESDIITFPSSSEKARDVVSCFGRNIIRIIDSTETDEYIKLRCGCKQTPRWEVCRDRSLRKGRWQGVPAHCSQQDRSNQVMRHGESSRSLL